MKHLLRPARGHGWSQGEIELTMLLPSFLHGRHFLGDETLDDTVRMPNLIMRPVARGDQAELIGVSRQARF